MNIIYEILFILGIVGNTFRFLVFFFSRRIWKISSVYACLAICSSMIDLLCVIRYGSILHSTTRNILYNLVGQKWWACKIYEFSFSFRILSTWITLFWMFERVIYISMNLRSSFNQLNSCKSRLIIPIIIMISILAWIIGFPLYMFQPITIKKNLLNSTINITKGYCQVDSNASIKWKKYFYENHFGINHFTIRCLFSELIPTGMIILFNCYIIYHLILTYYHLHKSKYDKQYKKQLGIISWMNNILIFHSFFCLLSHFSHIIGHLMAIKAHDIWWSTFSILINSSLNFYIYCLSGKPFRNEIYRFIKQFKTRIFQRLHTHHDRQNQDYQYRSSTYEMNNFQDRIQL